MFLHAVSLWCHFLYAEMYGIVELPTIIDVGARGVTPSRR